MNEVKEQIERLPNTRGDSCLHGSWDRQNCKVCARPTLQSQKECEACDAWFYSSNSKTKYCYNCSCNPARVKKYKLRKQSDNSL